MPTLPRQILVDCLQAYLRGEAAPLTEADWDALIELAAFHRVVRLEGETLYLRGDAQTHSDGPLAPENILGKVI